MLYSYEQIIKMFGSDRKLKQALKEKKVFKIEEGIYSDNQLVPELAIISKKYPNAIFTLNSAFYYHGLTDVIPNQYYLATPKETTKIRDKRVKQKFENSSELNLGVITMIYNTTEIKIYNKERMLVELLRNKSKISFDYYKEVLISYRKIIHKLDIQSIQEYALSLPKSNMILESLQMEVLWSLAY